MTTQNPQSSFVQYSEFFPDDSDQLRIKLTEMYTRLSSSLNVKEIALYDTIEQYNGQQFYNLTDVNQTRSGYRKVFPFGPIDPGTTLPINHGLDPNDITQYTFIGGTCETDAPDSRSIPYSSVSFITDQISVRVTSTQIEIFNGSTSAKILSGSITLEYLKT